MPIDTKSTTARRPPAGEDRAEPSAIEIARRVRSGAWLATEVIQQVLDKIDRLNPKLNAVIATRHEDALRDARAIDERVRLGLPVGRFAGVPFTAKDTIATTGLAATCGSNVMPGRTTDPDATAVARMRAAGAVLVGKTNCPEFGLSIVTSNPRYGDTANPVGPFTVGGSSGGEAAAVAAGLSVIGLGTDFGGSVRWPSQCTGVVGLRPTVGRVPASGQLPGVDTAGICPPNPRTLQGRLQVIGPLGRTVEEVELALRVMAGPDGLDPFAVPVPLRSSSAVRLDRLEIRFAGQFGSVKVDQQVAQALCGSVEVLARHGLKTTPGLPPALEYAADLYAQLRAADPLMEIRAASFGRQDELTDAIRRTLSCSVSSTEDELGVLWAERDRLRHELLRWLRGNRLLCLPVAVVPPFLTGMGLPSLNAQQLTEAEIVAPCRVTALFGLPSISVPCGFSADGAPLSLQLVAPPFREDLVLATARCLQSETQADLERPL
jgi:amidase